MKKLVVADFDGTLKPFEASCVSEAVKQRMDALLAKDVVFAVSSGRTFSELAGYLPEYLDRIYFICNDGAVYLKNQKPLYEKQIETEDLVRFFSAKEGVCRVFHGARQNYTCTKELPQEAKAFSPIFVKNVYEIKEKIFKITSFGERIELSQNSGLRTHWDGGETQTAQFVNRFATKGRALSDLQMRLMLSKFDTACIGDAGNDVAMMQGAKYSFCVGNRSPELASVCTHRVQSVESALDFCLNTF